MWARRHHIQGAASNHKLLFDSMFASKDNDKQVEKNMTPYMAYRKSDDQLHHILHVLTTTIDDVIRRNLKRFIANNNLSNPSQG